MERMACRLWLSLAVFGIVLGIVTAASIGSAPSSSSAIIAIRVAHLDLFWARLVFRDPAVHQAHLYFDEAWSNLRERRYQQSILAARQVLHHVRGVKDELPSLYSQNRESPKIAQRNAPES